jgi:hypothetical protein
MGEDHGPDRTEAGDGLVLCFAEGEPGGHPVGDPQAQVVLGLGQHPPRLPG